MTKHIRYIKRLPLEKEGSGVEVIDDEPIAIGMMLILEKIAVENETSALNYIRIGKMGLGFYFLWAEKKNPAAGELVKSTEEYKITADHNFRCEVDGGNAGDKIYVYLEGYTQHWRE